MTTPHTPLSALPQAALLIAATILVIFRSGNLLLVHHVNLPDIGRWGFLGGKIDFDESILRAALRELLAKTGVCSEATYVFTAVNAFDHDTSGMLRQHFLLIAVFCRYISGKPIADDDALEVRWFPLDALDSSDLVLSLGGQKSPGKVHGYKG